jgi:hypothetical protein
VKIAGNTAVNAALSISRQRVGMGSTDGSGSCDNEDQYLAGVVARAWSDTEIRWALRCSSAPDRRLCRLSRMAASQAASRDRGLPL